MNGGMSMSYTSYGEFMRIQRIKNHEVMGDMEKVLGSSLPFISAVESGKKNVPANWVEKIVKHYNLSEDEKQELLDVIEESKTQMKVSMINKGKYQRNAALQFARSFDDMDEETAKKIIDLLNKGGDV